MSDFPTSWREWWSEELSHHCKKHKHINTGHRPCNALSMPCRMEPEVNELILESLNINYIDESEYPSTTDIQNRCSSPFTSMVDLCDRHPEQVVAKFQAMHTSS